MRKPLIVYNNVPTFNNGRPIYNSYFKLWTNHFYLFRTSMHSHSQPHFVDSSHLEVSQLTLTCEQIIKGANMEIMSITDFTMMFYTTVERGV